MFKKLYIVTSQCSKDEKEEKFAVVFLNRAQSRDCDKQDRRELDNYEAGFLQK
jgi:hypothetical protein